MIKIAIIDDHQMFLEGMFSVLSQQENIKILFTETNAKKALNLIKIQVPDLVITDISMPEMNGIEFIKILKKEHPDIKILVLSMHKSHNHIQDIDGYLLKETGKDELLEAVNGIVLQQKKYFPENTPKNNGLIFNKNILSSREKEIVKLIAQGHTTEEIAESLFNSKHTIETHRKNIFLKLQVNNIAGLVQKAIYLGIIE